MPSRGPRMAIRIAKIVEGVLKSMFEKKIDTLNKLLEDVYETNNRNKELLNDLFTNPDSALVKALVDLVKNKSA